MKLLSVLASLCAIVAAPVMAQTGNWTVLPITQTILMGLNFLSEDVGFLTGAQNGQGATVAKTTDGGQTWTSLNIYNTAIPALFFFTTAAQSETDLIVGGISFLEGSLQYTSNGVDLTNSSEPGVLVDQTMSSYTLPGTTNGYATVGGYKVGIKNANSAALAITYDGGANYTFLNFENADIARYGAFPSEDLWFVTFGAFPSTSAEGDYIQTHHNVHMSATKGGKITHKKRPSARKHHRQLKQSAAGFNGTIARSTDGGNTWTTVLSSQDSYFNEMGCADVNTCYAISSGPYDTYVFKTTDGGNTWSNIKTVENTSMMACIVLSDNEVIIGGGSTEQLEGLVFHTTDGGNTWAQNTIPNQQIMSMDFVSGSYGFATTINNNNQANLLQYTA